MAKRRSRQFQPLTLLRPKIGLGLSPLLSFAFPFVVANAESKAAPARACAPIITQDTLLKEIFDIPEAAAPRPPSANVPGDLAESAMSLPASLLADLDQKLEKAYNSWTQIKDKVPALNQVTRRRIEFAGFLNELAEISPTLYTEASRRLDAGEDLRSFKPQYHEMFRKQAELVQAAYRLTEAQISAKGLAGLANTPENQAFYESLRKARVAVNLDQSTAEAVESKLIRGAAAGEFKKWLERNAQAKWSEITSQGWFSLLDAEAVFVRYATHPILDVQDPIIAEKLIERMRKRYQEAHAVGLDATTKNFRLRQLDDFGRLRAQAQTDVTDLTSSYNRITTALDQKARSAFANITAVTNASALTTALNQTKLDSTGLEDPDNFYDQETVDELLTRAYKAKVLEEYRDWLKANPNEKWSGIQSSLYSLRLTPNEMFAIFFEERVNAFPKENLPEVFQSVSTLPDYAKKSIAAYLVNSKETSEVAERFQTLATRYQAADQDIRGFVKNYFDRHSLSALSTDSGATQFRDSLQEYISRTSYLGLIPEPELIEIAREAAAAYQVTALDQYFSTHPKATKAKIDAARELSGISDSRIQAYVFSQQLAPQLARVDALLARQADSGAWANGSDDNYTAFFRLHANSLRNLTPEKVETLIDEFMKQKPVAEAMQEIERMAAIVSPGTDLAAYREDRRAVVRLQILEEALQEATKDPNVEDVLLNGTVGTVKSPALDKLLADAEALYVEHRKAQTRKEIEREILQRNAMMNSAAHGGGSPYGGGFGYQQVVNLNPTPEEIETELNKRLPKILAEPNPIDESLLFNMLKDQLAPIIRNFKLTPAELESEVSAKIDSWFEVFPADGALMSRSLDRMLKNYPENLRPQVISMMKTRLKEHVMSLVRSRVSAQKLGSDEHLQASGLTAFMSLEEARDAFFRRRMNIVQNLAAQRTATEATLVGRADGIRALLKNSESPARRALVDAKVKTGSTREQAEALVRQELEAEITAYEGALNLLRMRTFEHHEELESPVLHDLKKYLDATTYYNIAKAFQDLRLRGDFEVFRSEFNQMLNAPGYQDIAARFRAETREGKEKPIHEMKNSDYQDVLGKAAASQQELAVLNRLSGVNLSRAESARALEGIGFSPSLTAEAQHEYRVNVRTQNWLLELNALSTRFGELKGILERDQGRFEDELHRKLRQRDAQGNFVGLSPDANRLAVKNKDGTIIGEAITLAELNSLYERDRDRLLTELNTFRKAEGLTEFSVSDLISEQDAVINRQRFEARAQYLQGWKFDSPEQIRRHLVDSGHVDAKAEDQIAAETRRILNTRMLSIIGDLTSPSTNNEYVASVVESSRLSSDHPKQAELRIKISGHIKRQKQQMESLMKTLDELGYSQDSKEGLEAEIRNLYAELKAIVKAHYERDQFEQLEAAKRASLDERFFSQMNRIRWQLVQYAGMIESAAIARFEGIKSELFSSGARILTEGPSLSDFTTPGILMRGWSSETTERVYAERITDMHNAFNLLNYSGPRSGPKKSRRGGQSIEEMQYAYSTGGSIFGESLTGRRGGFWRQVGDKFMPVTGTLTSAGQTIGAVITSIPEVYTGSVQAAYGLNDDEMDDLLNSEGGSYLKAGKFSFEVGVAALTLGYSLSANAGRVGAVGVRRAMGESIARKVPYMSRTAPAMTFRQSLSTQGQLAYRMAKPAVLIGTGASGAQHIYNAASEDPLKNAQASFGGFLHDSAKGVLSNFTFMGLTGLVSPVILGTAKHSRTALNTIPSPRLGVPLAARQRIPDLPFLRAMRNATPGKPLTQTTISNMIDFIEGTSDWDSIGQMWSESENLTMTAMSLLIGTISGYDLTDPMIEGYHGNKKLRLKRVYTKARNYVNHSRGRYSENGRGLRSVGAASTLDNSRSTRTSAPAIDTVDLGAEDSLLHPHDEAFAEEILEQQARQTAAAAQRLTTSSQSPRSSAFTRLNLILRPL